MTITGVITAEILIGIVVGVLGRLLVPGKQPIDNCNDRDRHRRRLPRHGVGPVLGIPTMTNGIDWLELLVQVIVAAVGVALVSSLMGGRRRGGVVGGRRRSSLFR